MGGACSRSGRLRYPMSLCLQDALDVWAVKDMHIVSVDSHEWTLVRHITRNSTHPSLYTSERKGGHDKPESDKVRDGASGNLRGAVQGSRLDEILSASKSINGSIGKCDLTSIMGTDGFGSDENKLNGHE
jgi:hypothetical protein